MVHPFHGINTTVETRTQFERATAYAPLLRPGDAFSHVTAAVLWKAELPDRLLDGPIHVTAHGGRNRPTRYGIVGHRSTSPGDIGIVESLPAVLPAENWCDLSPILSLDDLVAVGDRFVSGYLDAWFRPVPAVSSLTELVLAVQRRPRGRSDPRQRTALELVRVGPRSRMESRLRIALIRSGLPEPRVGWPVLTALGELHPDLAYPDARIALEYEGEGHRTDKQRWRNDISRREAFEDVGWRQVRVHGGDAAEDFAGLIERVRRLLRVRR